MKQKQKRKQKQHSDFKKRKEPIKEDEPEPVVGEKPKNNKLKEMATCPDSDLLMTAHTLKHIHEKRRYCKDKGVQEKPETTTQVKTINPSREQPPGLQKQTPIKSTNLTNEIVDRYIHKNPDIVNNYARNERPMKAQRRQMNARSPLTNAC